MFFEFLSNLNYSQIMKLNYYQLKSTDQSYTSNLNIVTKWQFTDNI